MIRMPRIVALLLMVLALGLMCGLPSLAAQDAADTTEEIRPFSLILTILDKETLEPIPDVKVRYIGVMDDERFGDRGVTDANGEYVFELPSNKLEHLGTAIRCEGFIPMAMRWRGVMPGAATLQMERGTVIGGKVVDDTGAPIDGATVYLSVQRETHQPNAIYDIHNDYVKSGEDGSWTYDRAPAGFTSVRVAASDPRYVNPDSPAMKEVEPDDARARNLILTLRRGVTYKGTVVDTRGRPVEGADLRLAPEGKADFVRTTSGPAGQFQITVEPKQAFRLTILKEGYADQSIEVPAQDDPLPLKLILQSKR